MKRSTLYLLTLAFALMFSGQIFSAVSLNSDGWTIITPSSDSRIVYVSYSEGNDSNDGLSSSAPKKTIAAGNALIREGYPDHLLLKRGDVFPAPSSGNVLPQRWKNGRSAQEPIVFSYYGTSGARPVVKFTSAVVDHGLGGDGNRHPRHYQAYVGIDFYKSNSDPASADFTNASGGALFNFVTGGNDLLIEDCIIRFAQVTIQSGYGFEYHRPKIRRNIFVDAWKHNSTYEHTGSSRIQGLYMAGVKDSYLIEENFFDHCGWNSSVSGAGANMYNHNAYIQHSNVAGGIMRGNIFARASAHGLQARSGGLVDRNLFVLNSVAVNVGYHVTPPGDPDAFTFPNRAKENVILNGRRQNVNSSGEPQSAAVWGIWCHENLPGVLVEDNIVANRLESGVNSSYHEMETATMVNNISYAWSTGWDTNDPAWPHPDHDLGDYYASIGGSNDTVAYLNWLRSRPLGTMPWNMTAYPAINYIRAGFNKSPVTGYYNYGGSSYVSVTGVSLSPSSLNIEEAATSQLTATVTPGNATNPSVNWASSNTNVATVSSAGLVSAVAAGSATITVTTVDGSFTDQTSVTVTAPSGGGSGENLLSFDDFSGTSLLDMPTTYTLGTHAADVWMARVGTCGQCSEILTSGSDPYLNTGSGTTNGTFQVVAWPGSGDLEVNFDYRGQPRVRVFGGNTGDQISKFNNSNTLDELGTALMTSSSSWASGYLSVNLNGSYDYLVIQFTNGGDIDNASAAMEGSAPPPVPVTGVSVSPASVTLDIQDTSQLTATVSPANATNPAVSWSSANGSIATVSGSGLVTAVAAGTTTITVTTTDGSFTAQTSVTVSPPPPVNLVEFGDFSGSALLDMSTTYTLGTHATDVWMARVGTCGQCSQILGSGDPYIKAGYGTTNGAFQVIQWPGNGTLQVDFDFRNQPRIRVFGGDSGDQINKYDNAHTLTELDTALMASSSSWTTGSLSVTLNTSYDYIVIQFTNGGEIDNVSVILE